MLSMLNTRTRQNGSQRIAILALALFLPAAPMGAEEVVNRKFPDEAHSYS